MRFAITGATGLLGSNLAAVLSQAGHQVVATYRGSSRRDHLRDFPIRWVEASLDDPAGLTRAFDGCDGVFHCAAAVSVRFAVEPWIVEANIHGTSNVIRAVWNAGVRRLVHCSTVGAVGLTEDGLPSDETARWNMPEAGLGDAYVTTKRRAQELVLGTVEDGLNAVVVNPTYMIGPYDVRPSSGRLVVNLVKGRVPGFTPGRNNFVDVRDVARGMLLAFEKGQKGECYILGGYNMYYEAFMNLVCDEAGVSAPRFPVPNWAGRVLGLAGDLYDSIKGEEPLVNTATILWSQNDRFIFSSAKAERELGYKISPLRPAIRDAIDWFRTNKML